MQRERPFLQRAERSLIGISRIREMLRLSDPPANYRTVRAALERLGVRWVAVTQRGEMATACDEQALRAQIDARIGAIEHAVPGDADPGKQ